MFRGALAGAGLIITPGAAPQDHEHHGAASGPGPSSQAWTPLLFDEHQASTVEILSERIIPATDTPGARGARVVEYIDLILHDGEAEVRNLFLEGIGHLDGIALRRHEQPFARCTESQQVDLLGELDAENNEFFREAKRLTAEGYYTSKIGIDELNKDGRVPNTFACDHEKHR